MEMSKLEPTNSEEVSALFNRVKLVASNLEGDSSFLIHAFLFGLNAHGNERRRYTNRLYFSHPVHVLEILYGALGKDLSIDIATASLLHDTVEDCDISLNKISDKFGKTAAHYVSGLTNAATWLRLLNRSDRKMIDRMFLSMMCSEVQTIKCADIISNVSCIVEHDRLFANTYIQECAECAYVLTKADSRIISVLADTLENEKNKLKSINQ